MSDTIQLRAGNRADMPILADREPGYVRDEQALYVGTPEGNVKLTGALEDRVTALEERLADYPAPAVAGIAPEVELAAVIEAVNGLISALKAGGLMRTEER